MRRRLTVKPYVYNKKLRRRSVFGPWLFVLVIPAAAFSYWWGSHSPVAAPAPAIIQQTPAPAKNGTAAALKPGDILGIDSVQTFTPVETAALARQNYGAATLPVTVGVTKYTFHYLSQLPTGQQITIYGRAYLPSDLNKNLPIFAFAPGTTGIGDECAASLENVKVANWGDYDSHMAMYASQGFAAVTTDYEGMRDPTRIHHYMVGELEGRAVLDSVRALENLPEASGRLDDSNVFLAGYSQGGHAAFWADKIASTYSPEIKPKGVIGFGPVMSVKETLTDVTRGANINWFGPYVLYSYGDYYQTSFGQVLLPHWENTLAVDVPAHCINTDIEYWGTKPEGVYTSQFLQAAETDDLAAEYPALDQDLNMNAVGADPTPSAKLINSGSEDNVVLPQQQEAELPLLCGSSTGPVQLNIWPKATHYTTMVVSLNYTLNWMHTIMKGQKAPTSCS
jgi:hypothetical protein